MKDLISPPAPEKPLDLSLFVQGIAFVCALLIVYVAYDSIVRDRDDSSRAAARQLTAITDLAADDIARGLSGVRDTLRLLSRMPSFRQTAQTGMIAPAVRSGLFRFEAAADSIAVLADMIDIRQFSAFQDLTLLGDILIAGCRRVVYSLGLLSILESPREAEAEDEDAMPGIAPRIGKLGPPRTAPVFWGGSFRGLRESILQPGETLSALAEFLDSGFRFGISVVSDPEEARRVLIASLNDKDLIRSVAVKTLEGKTIAEATEIGEPLEFFSNWMTRSAKGGKPFLSGPVTFDEGLGRPLWQAAVPLRNQDRIPFGILSSQVDLGFLGEMAARLRVSPASHLLVVDEEGTVIAHPKTSMVVSQVNMSRSNPVIGEVLGGEDGFREIRIGGISYFAAFRNLRKLDPANLPGWGILYLSPVSELNSSWWKSVLNGVILAAISLYLLYHTVDIIIASLDEGVEA